MKLLLLLAASANAGTVEYIRTVCGTAAGDNGAGMNIAFGACIDFNIWDAGLCAGTGLFSTTGFTGITGNSLSNPPVSQRTRTNQISHRVKYSKVDGALHVDYYEAEDCTGAVSTNYAPADIAFATAGTGACYSDDSTAASSLTTAATCCATANTTNVAGQNECLAGKSGGYQWVETWGYYLEECTTADNGGGCVMVDLAVYKNEALPGTCAAKGLNEGTCYTDSTKATAAANSACGNAACTVYSCTGGTLTWVGWYGTLPFFVFGENYVGQELTVATRTNDFSAVCDADGQLDLNSHDNAGNTVIDSNSMLNLVTDTCKGNCSALNTAKTACETERTTIDTDKTYYMTTSDPCSPPASATSGSSIVSAMVATLVGVVMILA